MGRVWILALGMILALVVVRISGPLGGAETQLTASLCVGGGIAAAYIGSAAHTLARGLWVLAGVVIGALGFALGAMLYPDTLNGLLLGGVVPTLLIALATMWTRRQTDFLAAIIGAGALTGVYATRFDTDPQSLNYSLPIAIGQTLLPLALGFIAGVLVQWLTTSDEQSESARDEQAAADVDSALAGAEQSASAEVAR